MIDQPILSIIIPVYNLEEYIEKCLSSLEGQVVDGSVQVYCIDDGSQDHSKEKIQPFCQRNANIHYLYKTNGGVSSARNYGLNQVKSRYITFIDGDDYVSKDYVSTILSHLKENIEMLCFGYLFAYSDDSTKVDIEIKDQTLHLEKHDGLLGFLRFRFQEIMRPFVFNKVFRQDVIENYHLRFDEKKKIGEDTLFNASYLERIHEVKMISNPLYFYYMRETSVMHRYNTHHLEDSIRYFYSFQQIANDNDYEIDPHDLEAYYISRWFGQINNESKSHDYSLGLNQMKKFLQEPYFVKHKSDIHFSRLPMKLKVYYILIQCHCTLLIYSLMYIKNSILTQND